MRLLHKWVVISTEFLVVTALACPTYSQNDDNNATREVILNECNSNAFPKRYRAVTDSPNEYWNTIRQDAPKLNLEGYQNTRMSGSAQFCAQNLAWMRKQWTDSSAMIIDLRMEAHGFLDDQAVGLFCPKNWDRLLITGPELQRAEDDDFASLNQTGSAIVYTKVSETEAVIDPRTMSFSNASTEAMLLQRLGIKYHRIFIPDHQRPRDLEVQQFIDLHDPSVWFHFHCKGGRGRTTTAMVMRDMLINPKVSTADIILRNTVYGGIDLTDFARLKGSYREEFAKERLAFIKMFHIFAKAYALRKQTWKEFLQRSCESTIPDGRKSFGFIHGGGEGESECGSEYHGSTTQIISNNSVQQGHKTNAKL